MSDAFGCARDLYDLGEHPRVLIDADGIVRLKKRVRSGLAGRVWKQLRRKLGPVKRELLTTADPAGTMDFYKRNTWWGFVWRASMALRDLALMGVVDNDADAVECVRRIITNDKSVMGGASYGGTGAIAYDIAYHMLPAIDRKALASQFLARAIKSEEECRKNVHKGIGGNTTVGTVTDPLILGLCIHNDPGIGDMMPMVRRAADLMDASLHVAWNVDGFPEEDIGYGTDVAGVIAWYVDALRRAGVYDAYRACPRYNRFGKAVLHFVLPWGGNLSMTGDHWPVFWNRELILARLARETRDPTLMWLLGTLQNDGREYSPPPHKGFNDELALRRGGHAFNLPATDLSLLAIDEIEKITPVHPADAGTPTAFRDRGRGIVSFRSSWKEDATYVTFDGSHRSPAAQGHAHASCGHFSLVALGEHFGVDTGRYGNEQSEHNLVLIDGKSGRSHDGHWIAEFYHGNLTGYTPGDFVDSASVDSSLQHNCMWARRHLAMVKGDQPRVPSYVWTVEDINKANDWAEYWWTLNTSPENTIELRDDGATVTGWRKGNHLDVHFVLPRAEEYPRAHTLAMSQDVRGTVVDKYLKDSSARIKEFARPAMMVHGIVFERPRLVAKVAGYNGRFMSIMLPRVKGAQPAVVETLVGVNTTLAAKVTFAKAGVEDTIIWAYEHHQLRANGVEARGRWCVVRRAINSRKVLAYHVDEATRLEIDGKPVRVKVTG